MIAIRYQQCYHVMYTGVCMFGVVVGISFITNAIVIVSNTAMRALPFISLIQT